MQYISTRGNHPPVSSSTAISLGMVPQGGLFVPESIPRLDKSILNRDVTYQDIACQVFSQFLTDFTDDEIGYSVKTAYNAKTFGDDSIIQFKDMGPGLSVMELWHGPTAAFKDVALQIMPHLMQFSKKKTGNNTHTVILVATSGDTGKAALEGFKDCDGISIIVFYPHEGVSEIQKLQMATTDGLNTHVLAVKGNFDDCQTGVKKVFSDTDLRIALSKKTIELSSANSINWGRLCPQIVYYVKSYNELVLSGKITNSEAVNFCVPTGNFGNILAAYYAKLMGVPINKLICASNRNNVLSDFFSSGTYNCNRDFYKTNSPSMDILLSSNLERFLFELTGHDSSKLNNWYESLSKTGSFSVDSMTRDKMNDIIISGWVDETEVLSVIRDTFNKNGYIPDTHTAVGIALCKRLGSQKNHTVIASTASPYKFSCDVLKGIKEQSYNDEFECINQIASLSGTKIHRAVDNLIDRPVNHDTVITIDQMQNSVLKIIDSLKLQ
jgi:threonine synthase